MAVPSRLASMKKRLRKDILKMGKIEKEKSSSKDPEDVRKLLEMWEKSKKEKLFLILKLLKEM